ncbi:amino acid permease [Helicobacter acinonychis]|nr:amino acid permease [Helicobacter acinonychis]
MKDNTTLSRDIGLNQLMMIALGGDDWHRAFCRCKRE